MPGKRMTYAVIAGLMMMAGFSTAASAEDRCAGRKPYLIYYATHAIAEPVWSNT